MSNSNISSSFCLLCYKTTISTAENKTPFDEVKKFLNVWLRFTSNSSCISNGPLIEKELNAVFNQINLLNCCAECHKIILEFCEVYHQLKCLELQLDLKVDKLLEIINLSNRIPIRWTTIKETLQQKFQSYPGKVKECQDAIGEIRKTITNSGVQRSTNAFPRVLLDKSKIIGHHGSIQGNEAHVILENDPSIEIKHEYPHLQISSNDSSPPILKNAVTTPSFLECQTTQQTRNKLLTNQTHKKKHPSQNKTPKKSSKVLLNISHGFDYVNCEICNRKILQHRRRTHYEAFHDLSKVTDKSTLAHCNQDGCTAYFFNENQLHTHRRLEHQNNINTIDLPVIKTTWMCTQCGKKFQQKWNWRKHILFQKCTNKSQGQNYKNIRSKEWKKRKEIFRCSFCGEIFAYLGSLRRHSKAKHIKEFDERNAQKISKDPLEIPIKIESNSKKGVVASKTVQRKNFSKKCSDCFKTFRPANVLWSHRQNVHLKHVCIKCGNEFGDKKDLEAHINYVHDGFQGQFFECKECGKKFSREINLRHHTIVHTKEKPFSCHLCPEVFSHRQSIRRHLRRTHGFSDVELKETNLRRKDKVDEMPCKICGEMFDRAWRLIKHYKTTHHIQNAETFVEVGNADEVVDSNSANMKTDGNFNEPLEILPNN